MGRDAFLVQLTVKSRNIGPRMGVSAGRTLAKITFYSVWKECGQLLFRFLYFSKSRVLMVSPTDIS